ncbi:MAG: deoxyhypusine synthase, partial [Candidatus Diapherotrites archaeon]|nr:deoxyhypusine synthase [Candidatus Diapherotrites archaeon]
EMKRAGATVVLGFTANLVASGLRGVIAELCRKKFVDAIVTTAGSIDHDVIKTLVDYELGSFGADDVKLHKSGINRVGNIFIPNKGFVLFEKKIQQWLGEFCREKECFSPSELAGLIGGKIKNADSFLHWCSENKIPVFCPGVTDGAVGLQMYFFKQDHRKFCVDVTGDMDALAQMVLTADKTGAIILGGGISKHHIIGANLVRGGLDFAVYVSTASEFDGSLSGARTSEAKSWGKIKEKARAVHVFADATIAFPLIALVLKEEKLL